MELVANSPFKSDSTRIWLQEFLASSKISDKPKAALEISSAEPHSGGHSSFICFILLLLVLTWDLSLTCHPRDQAQEQGDPGMGTASKDLDHKPKQGKPGRAGNCSWIAQMLCQVGSKPKSLTALWQRCPWRRNTQIPAVPLTIMVVVAETEFDGRVKREEFIYLSIH